LFFHESPPPDIVLTLIQQTFILPVSSFRIRGKLTVKDALVFLMTIRRCKDAQYRVDKVFSKILGLCREKRGKNNDEVRGE
jgi:hypothetical protein